MTKKEMVVEIVNVAPIPLEKSKRELTDMLLNDCTDSNVERAYQKLVTWNYDIMACGEVQSRLIEIAKGERKI